METKIQVIYLLMTGKKKRDVKEYIENRYLNKQYNAFLSTYLYISSFARKKNGARTKELIDTVPQISEFIDVYNVYDPKPKDDAPKVDFDEKEWWWIK